jgi:hypothetical protein
MEAASSKLLRGGCKMAHTVSVLFGRRFVFRRHIYNIAEVVTLIAMLLIRPANIYRPTWLLDQRRHILMCMQHEGSEGTKSEQSVA